MGKEKSFFGVRDIFPLILVVSTAGSAVLDLLAGAGMFALIGLISILMIATITVVWKKWGQRIPALLFYVFLLFISISVYWSNRLDLYKVFFFHDIILHFLSGIIITLIAVNILPKHIENELKMREKIIFLLILAVAAAGFWEIIEFLTDFFFHADVQRNTSREWEIFYSEIQNPGIVDTMNDMINGSVGGIIGCIIFYFEEKRKKKTAQNRK